MRPGWCAASPRPPIRPWCCLTRWRQCSDDCRPVASRSGGSPPNAAATRTPSTRGARPGRSSCPPSARWLGFRWRPRRARTPAGPRGPRWACTLTSFPHLCSVSACPGTRVPPSARCSRCNARPGSRRCSRSGSCAVTIRRFRRDPCGSARTPWWSRPPRTSSAAAALRLSASAASRRPRYGGCSSCSVRVTRSSATTATSTGAASGSPARYVSAQARNAGRRGGTTATPTRPQRRRCWPGPPPAGLPGWPASLPQPPGIPGWRTPWRAVASASKRNCPSTPCSRTWRRYRVSARGAGSGRGRLAPQWSQCTTSSTGLRLGSAHRPFAG